MQTSSRRPLAAALALLCCLSLMTPVAAAPGVPEDAGVPYDAAIPNGSVGPCTGTVTDEANGTTVISVQGFEFGKDGGKRPAKLVGVGPSGEIRWVHQMAEKYDVRWGYDVDPLPNGNLFVTAELRSEGSLFYEFNPRTQETVWVKRIDIADTHDADLINNGSAILIANMRNYNESTGRNDDRLFVYNRTTEEITWEWYFDDHYDRAELQENDPRRENYTDDWTHVNDVDKIGDGLYLASPRNFDQAIVVNRSTNEIVMKLGADGKKNILDEQHNPDYLESRNGTPTILVGDSGNDRIVEYANPDGDLKNGTGWERTWTLKGDLKWPRDADRLPNGNTLVTDSSNNRVIEVTPKGEVVWEFYAPWLVYDAARVSAGEHGGPTATDLNATGTYEVSGSAKLHENETALNECHNVLQNVSGWAEGETPTPTDESTEGAMGDDTTGSDANGNDGNDGGSDGNAGDGNGDSPGSSAPIPGFGPLAALAGLLVALAVARRRSR